MTVLSCTSRQVNCFPACSVTQQEETTGPHLASLFMSNSALSCICLPSWKLGGKPSHLFHYILSVQELFSGLKNHSLGMQNEGTSMWQCLESESMGGMGSISHQQSLFQFSVSTNTVEQGEQIGFTEGSIHTTNSIEGRHCSLPSRNRIYLSIKIWTKSLHI